MMKELKFSLRILKYSHGKLICAVAAVVIFLVSLFIECSSILPLKRQLGDRALQLLYNAQYMGGVLFCLAGFFVLQCWHSLNAAGIMASSPKNRASHCKIPTLILGVCTFGSFTFLVILRLILCAISKWELPFFIVGLYLTTIGIFITICYTAVSYHYFVLSILAYYCVFLLADGLTTKINISVAQALFETYPIFFKLPVALVICYAVLALGILIHSLVARILYKKPYSKWSQSASLRRYL